MSTQVAIRLDDEALATLDAEVAAGLADSRSDAVRRAITYLSRQQAYRLDEAIFQRLREDGAELYPDLAGLTSMPKPGLD